MNITALSEDMIELAAQMDCVANPANRELTHGGTLSGLIYDAAGSEALEFDLSGVLSTAAGSAVLTEGYSLCRFIIHTLTPYGLTGIPYRTRASNVHSRVVGQILPMN